MFHGNSVSDHSNTDLWNVFHENDSLEEEILVSSPTDNEPREYSFYRDNNSNNTPTTPIEIKTSKEREKKRKKKRNRKSTCRTVKHTTPIMTTTPPSKHDHQDGSEDKNDTHDTSPPILKPRIDVYTGYLNIATINMDFTPLLLGDPTLNGQQRAIKKYCDEELVPQFIQLMRQNVPVISFAFQNIGYPMLEYCIQMLDTLTLCVSSNNRNGTHFKSSDIPLNPFRHHIATLLSSSPPPPSLTESYHRIFPRHFGPLYNSFTHNDTNDDTRYYKQARGKQGECPILVYGLKPLHVIEGRHWFDTVYLDTDKEEEKEMKIEKTLCPEWLQYGACGLSGPFRNTTTVGNGNREQQRKHMQTFRHPWLECILSHTSQDDKNDTILNDVNESNLPDNTMTSFTCNHMIHLKIKLSSTSITMFQQNKHCPPQQQQQQVFPEPDRKRVQILNHRGPSDSSEDTTLSKVDSYTHTNKHNTTTQNNMPMKIAHHMIHLERRKQWLLSRFTHKRTSELNKLYTQLALTQDLERRSIFYSDQLVKIDRYFGYTLNNHERNTDDVISTMENQQYEMALGQLVNGFPDYIDCVIVNSYRCDPSKNQSHHNNNNNTTGITKKYEYFLNPYKNAMRMMEDEDENQNTISEARKYATQEIDTYRRQVIDVMNWHSTDPISSLGTIHQQCHNRNVYNHDNDTVDSDRVNNVSLLSEQQMRQQEQSRQACLTHILKMCRSSTLKNNKNALDYQRSECEMLIWSSNSNDIHNITENWLRQYFKSEIFQENDQRNIDNDDKIYNSNFKSHSISALLNHVWIQDTPPSSSSSPPPPQTMDKSTDLIQFQSEHTIPTYRLKLQYIQLMKSYLDYQPYREFSKFYHKYPHYYNDTQHTRNRDNHFCYTPPHYDISDNIYYNATIHNTEKQSPRFQTEKQQNTSSSDQDNVLYIDTLCALNASSSSPTTKNTTTTKNVSVFTSNTTSNSQEEDVYE